MQQESPYCFWCIKVFTYVEIKEAAVGVRYPECLLSDLWTNADFEG